MDPSSVSEVAPGVRVQTLGEAVAIVPPQQSRPEELNHWLVRVTIQPGAALPYADAVESALFQVESGTISVTVEKGREGDLWINVGSGGPIRSGDEVICEKGACHLPLHREVILGPGNMVSLKQSSFALVGGEAEGAVLVGTALLPYASARCWICPSPW